jgi:pyruvate dehydrogenase E2 component (dihydrolipoamide acetyltransferase)
MAEELFIPKLGQTVEEVTLVDWLVEDGAKVEFGTPLLDVETDKAVFPLESSANGYLHRGPFKAGDVVSVLTVVGIIGKKDETFIHPHSFDVGAIGERLEENQAIPTPALGEAGETTTPIIAEANASSTDLPFISPRAKKMVKEKNLELSKITPTGYGGVRIVERDVVAYLENQPKVTPVAQKVAEQAGLDLSGVQGTGLRGMVTKADVEQAIKEHVQSEVKEKAPVLVPSPSLVVTAPAASVPSQAPLVEVTNRIPLKGVKRIIYERMGASVHTTARVTLVMEMDATQFVQVREQFKASISEPWGFTPGYNDLLGIMVARSLRELPYMNARVSTDCTAIEWLGHVNLGMAVDTERGLVVPVIKDADLKGLKTFGSEFRAMVDRARAGRSLPDDLSGGTFTITNLGMYDIDAFSPVINMPEIAILGVGRITPKVVPVNDQPVIRSMLTLSLVFDHRLVDGAPAARFLQRIKQYVENPLLLLG